MSGFQCPYCSMIMPLSADTLSRQYPAFSTQCGYMPNFKEPRILDNSCLAITFYKCPNCGQYTIYATGMGAGVKNTKVQIRPVSNAKQFPEYIPAALRQDYEEACAIVSLSPKASATLSRRCLQGMIRDFWDIKEPNLSKAISQLEGKIPAQQWRVINGVRRIGNIGAHMEKDINLIVDIDPDEAEKLLKLIEHLFKQWYIERHEEECLYADIVSMDESKQASRKKVE